jgi:hypothetical protein
MAAPRNPIYADTVHEWNARALERATEGLMSVLLSLKKKPLIRYERMSAMGKKLGEEVNVSTTNIACRCYGVLTCDWMMLVSMRYIKSHNCLTCVRRIRRRYC